MSDIENTWVGARTDSPLSELGNLQAEATGIYLKQTVPQLSAIYSSPLSSARDTANAISNHFGVPIEIVDDQFLL